MHHLNPTLADAVTFTALPCAIPTMLLLPCSRPSPSVPSE